MNPSSLPVPDIFHSRSARRISPRDEQRIVMTRTCTDCAGIPKVPGAGGVDDSGDWPVQTMHNGIKVAAGSKGGPWMTELVGQLEGHLDPPQEKCFHHLLEALGNAVSMVELGSSWSYYSLWFQRRFPGASTLIVEPGPDDLAIARYHFALNGMEGEFVHAAFGAEPVNEVPFHGEGDGAAGPAKRISVDSLLEGRGPVDLLRAEIRSAEALLLLEGMRQSLAAGRIRVLFLSLHFDPGDGAPARHRKSLDWLRLHGARIIAEHSMEESDSGEDLIVASFDPSLKLTVETSSCRSRESLVEGPGRNPGAAEPALPSGDTRPILTELTRIPAGGRTAPGDLFTSYAQHGEDVLLWRALREVQQGFYIDVGAYHPVADSVTKAFYDLGWRGINIEPVAGNAAGFIKARPRDINLEVAAYSTIGSRVFYEIPGSGLSTFDFMALGEARMAGWPVKEHLIATTTLAEICRQHVTGEIHFLKVDAEQSEREVLEGADFRTFRPWIILVEATLPNRNEPSHQAWEFILLEAGYRFLFFDGLNRFYASAEKAAGLRQHFDRPANPLDGYRTHRELEWERLLQAPAQADREDKIQALSREKHELKTKLGELTTAHAAAVADLKALRHKLRHHAANPKRALQLWWNR